MSGLTPWFPRHVEPVRNGIYQCEVRLIGGCVTNWDLEWDGIGFKVPMPMVVRKWRGLTRRAHAARAAEKGGSNV